ncbi:MAG: hypothetical protein ABIF87_13620 [Pseudomonadota bacterium]
MTELAIINNRTLEGFNFCKKAYQVFYKIRYSPDGLRRIRIRDDRTKKLIEEVLPIARYVQAVYYPGRRIRIRWIDGNQNYDGIAYHYGDDVKKGLQPKKIYLEVTNAVHQKDHLHRKHLHEKGHVFGYGGIKLNKTTKEIESTPVVRNGYEHISELVDLVKRRIGEKEKKKYPDPCVLIIQYNTDTIICSDEWEVMIKALKGIPDRDRFREIFLLESNFRRQEFI